MLKRGLDALAQRDFVWQLEFTVAEPLRSAIAQYPPPPRYFAALGLFPTTALVLASGTGRAHRSTVPAAVFADFAAAGAIVGGARGRKHFCRHAGDLCALRAIGATTTTISRSHWLENG